MISCDEILPLVPFTLDEIDLPLSGKQRGKGRDWYSLENQRGFIIITDRISAFDIVLWRVPYIGQVLNQLTNWCMNQTKDIIDNHLVSEPYPNAVIVQVASPFPVEVVVWGYITGVSSTALWHRYSLGERIIYGYNFSDGFQKKQAFNQPIITTTTKGGVTGHDERLTCSEVVDLGLIDERTWVHEQAVTIELFRRGQLVAARAGLVLVDIKYEFGRLPDDRVVVITEIRTPDSSRFWKANTYREHFEAGEEPENFDKEFVRIEYTKLGFRDEGIPPVMPDVISILCIQIMECTSCIFDFPNDAIPI